MKKTKENPAVFRDIYDKAKSKAFRFTSDFTKLTSNKPQWSADLFWWMYSLITQRDFAVSILRYFVNRGRQDGILSRSDWKYLMRLI